MSLTILSRNTGYKYARKKIILKKSTTRSTKIKFKKMFPSFPSSSLEYSGSQVFIYPAFPSYSKSDSHSVEE